MSLFTSCLLLNLASLVLGTQYPILATTHGSQNSTVGIGLTVDHAAVSVRYENGTFEDLGRIEANGEYKKLMQRLSAWEARHSHPPYQDDSEKYRDYPRQLLRSMRMKAGLPASPDVGVLADLLEDAAQLAFPEEGSPRSAIISYPALYALYQEDIFAAAAYRNISTLRSLQWEQDQPVELVSAYVGHGLGICKDPVASWSKCMLEEARLPTRHVILFEYTESALLLHYRQLARAWVDPSTDFSLGQALDLGSANGSRGAAIAEFVSRFLRGHVGCYGGPYYPGKCPKAVSFVLTGSAQSYGGGNDQEILTAIAVAVDEFGSEAEIFFANPDFVAARGAAELAWRATLLDSR